MPKRIEFTYHINDVKERRFLPFIGAICKWKALNKCTEYEAVIITNDRHDILNSVCIYFDNRYHLRYRIETLRCAMQRTCSKKVTVNYKYCSDIPVIIPTKDQIEAYVQYDITSKEFINFILGINDWKMHLASIIIIMQKMFLYN